MDSTIWASIITGIFTLIATLISSQYLFKGRLIRNKGSRKLKSVIDGKWKGTVTEDLPVENKVKQYNVVWEFKIKWRKISCTSYVIYEKPNSSEKKYTLNGRIVQDRFIMLEYYLDDNSQINFGTELIEVNDLGNSFSGKYVGFSSKQSKIITGKINATKIAS